MKERIHKPILTLLLLLLTLGATAQERLYIDEWSFTPGGEMDYFTIGIENAAYEDYTAFQFDLLLSPGLELAYDEENEPDCTNRVKGYLCNSNSYSLSVAVEKGYIRFICYNTKGLSFTKSKRTGNLLDIGVIPGPYLKPGDIDITLKNVKFARVTEEYGLKVDEMSLTGLTADAESTLPVKVSASNKYSTAVFPFDIDAIPAGLEVYSCNSTNGESLVLTRQSSAKAYTPYILYAPNGYSGTLSGAVDASKYSEVVTDGYLSGTVVPAEVSGGEGHYVMQNKGEGPMFYKVTDTSFSIPAGKCWLTLPANLQGSTLFRLDGSTGIGEVKGEDGKVKTIYDLQGRKVEVPSKGLYIIDGKKVLVK